MAQPLYLENISDKGMERPSGQDDQHNFKRQSPQERAWSGRGGSGKKQVVVTMVKIHGMKFFKSSQKHYRKDRMVLQFGPQKAGDCSLQMCGAES